MIEGAQLAWQKGRQAGRWPNPGQRHPLAGSHHSKLLVVPLPPRLLQPFLDAAGRQAGRQAEGGETVAGVN